MGVSLPRLILFDNSHINQRSVRAHNLPLICRQQSDKLAFPLVGKEKKKRKLQLTGAITHNSAPWYPGGEDGSFSISTQQWQSSRPSGKASELCNLFVSVPASIRHLRHRDFSRGPAGGGGFNRPGLSLSKACPDRYRQSEKD